MKKAYPITVRQGEKYLIVYIPDLDINTQGTDMVNAIEMARDAIGITGIDMQDDGEDIPEPSGLEDIKARYPDDTVMLVDAYISGDRQTVDDTIAMKYGNDPMERNRHIYEELAK